MFFRKRPAQAVGYEITKQLGGLAGQQVAFIRMPDIADACPVSSVFNWDQLPAEFHTCITIELRLFAVTTMFVNFCIEFGKNHFAFCQSTNQLHIFLNNAHAHIVSPSMCQSLTKPGMANAYEFLTSSDYYLSFSALSINSYTSFIRQYANDGDSTRFYMGTNLYMLQQLHGICTIPDPETTAAALMMTTAKIFGSSGSFARDHIINTL